MRSDHAPVIEPQPVRIVREALTAAAAIEPKPLEAEMLRHLATWAHIATLSRLERLIR